MAVINVKFGWTGVEYGGDSTAYRMTRAATVLADPADGLLVAKAALPAPGDAHPDDANYHAEVPTVKQKAPGYFEALIRYVTGGTEEFPQDEEPLSVPADISWDSLERQVAYDIDLDGVIVGSRLFERFDPPLVRTIKDPRLTIERNQASFDPDDMLLYQDTINTVVFWGAAIGKARMENISSRAVNAATPYERTRYQIVFRMKLPAGTAAANAWMRQILHQGHKYLDAGGVERRSSVIEYLDAASKKTTDAAPFWLYFREYEAQNWTPLGLGP